MSPRDLADSAARDRIRTALDETLLVEAAAGTGKTTELVERIVNVLASGRSEIGEIVAVTFTEKAAGELKLRLRERLERERQDEMLDTAGRTRVERALSGLEEAHINTIHGFCADLLRERPVEAQVDPAFEVLVEQDAERLHARLFDAWLTEQLNDPPESIRRALHRPAFGNDDEDDDRGPVDRLRKSAWELVGWRDFERRWRRDAAWDRRLAITDISVQLRRVAELTAHPVKKSDHLYVDTAFLRDLSSDLERGTTVGSLDLDEMEGRLVALSHDQRLRSIRRSSGDQYGAGALRSTVLAARDALRHALSAFVAAADADLAAALQPDLAHVTALYEREKARAGRLDFLDLLLRARDLLKDEEVRRDLHRRYARVFVDEFQDTDPIQAELLFLLTADDPSVDNWRLVRPRRGALFIVADPKQSIYRFRRAGVGVYEDVKDLLQRAGVEPVTLDMSFRAAPCIQRFVNHAFEPVMTGDRRTQQADYVRLQPYRVDDPSQPSLVVLPVPRPYGRMRISGAAIEPSLPPAVASFVEWLIRDSGWTVTERTPQSGPEARVPIASRHVCILLRRFETWNRDATRPYVDALEARGIPHLLVGGRSFDHREEVETMVAALTAIEWPDDELAVFATLRGSLFAISDATLLFYRQLVGRFHPLAVHEAPSASPDVQDTSAIFEALALLRRLHNSRNRIPVSATLSALLDGTRAHAGFALRQSGEQALANVLHIAELARRYEATGGLSFRGFTEDLRDGHFGQASEAPILEEGGEGVRIMTVHRAKGLEFPVVILADMTANSRPRSASRYVDAERHLCALRLLGCAPHELHEHANDELDREAAEALRVTYVAATRARDLLVVPAVGDEPYDDKWLSVLNPAIYPPLESRRQAEDGPRCPPFGRDSVMERPNGDPASRSTVSPGQHLIGGSELGAQAGTRHSALESYPVVWWDPHVLSLESRPSLGLRQTELIGKDASPDVVEADLAAYYAWARDRDTTRDRGRRIDLPIETVAQRVQRLAGNRVEGEAEDDDVTLIEVDRDVGRPAGRRHGTLVHDVMASVPLDADASAIGRVAGARARVLGATESEVASATTIVSSVLRHDLLARARAAHARGRCRRESPVTIATPDGTLVEGVVDLAFEEDRVWHVVDFKTDRDLATLMPQYRMQVRLYAEAIARATSQPARAFLMQV